MRFLVTNDDGHDAPGIAALVQAAQRFGEVIVVAPETPQSYMGHRVTTGAPLQVWRDSGDRYRVHGTPADCARIALRCLELEIDWVLSGVNQGGNLGADTYTSGTVAAAREAALLGYRSIALSQYVARGRRLDWDATARHADEVLEVLLARVLPAHCFWNVNLPHPPEDCPPGPMVDCPLDYHPLDVRFSREGDRYLFCGSYQARPHDPESDVGVCFRGDTSVTLISLVAGAR